MTVLSICSYKYALESNVRVWFEVHLRDQKLDEETSVRVVPVCIQSLLELSEILAENLPIDVDAKAVGDIVPYGKFDSSPAMLASGGWLTSASDSSSDPLLTSQNLNIVNGSLTQQTITKSNHLVLLTL